MSNLRLHSTEERTFPPANYSYVRTIEDYLKETLTRGGSDLHIAVNSPPMIRLHGQLMLLGFSPLNSEATEDLLMKILDELQKKVLLTKKNVDFAYTIQYGNTRRRFRCNLFYERCGLCGVFRAIPDQIPTLKELGLPESLKKLVRYHQGLVLITGPAGCGKTTTLAALINIINEERPAHILTIEDPIEYIHPSKKSFITQRQVGLHTKSFQSALRAAIREDPDVLLLGELRDLETTQMAITAAETGHLVLSTLHTVSAIKTIDRIVGIFPPSQQAQVRTMFSESMKGILTQKLVPRADGMGRVPAIEIIFGCPSIANLIREGKALQVSTVVQTSRNLGMKTMDESLMELYNSNLISPAEAYEHSADKKIFEQYLNKQ